jgi:small subunit ribosomal protein S9
MSEPGETQSSEKTGSTPGTRCIVSSGKRKSALARATITAGKGRVWINNIPLEIYTPDLAREKIREPLILAGARSGEVDIRVNVSGGGIMGRADAARTAIAKGIIEFFNDEELLKKMKEYDRSLIVSDIRRKLPKKPLGRGARKKRQKSYR